MSGLPSFIHSSISSESAVVQKASKRFKQHCPHCLHSNSFGGNWTLQLLIGWIFLDSRGETLCYRILLVTVPTVNLIFVWRPWKVSMPAGTMFRVFRWCRWFHSTPQRLRLSYIQGRQERESTSALALGSNVWPIKAALASLDQLFPYSNHS